MSLHVFYKAVKAVNGPTLIWLQFENVSYIAKYVYGLFRKLK